MKNNLFIGSRRLPDEIQDLIYQAERNTENSAPYRRATLELQARTALELSRVTSRLTLATGL